MTILHPRQKVFSFSYEPLDLQGTPGRHLHDNTVGVEVGGGLRDFCLSGGGRHV